MSSFLPSILSLIPGYLLGSISFAVIIGKAHGIDIFKHGSGNPGATNVKRVLGRGPGNLCFFLDLGKGLLAALLPWLLFREAGNVATLMILGGAGSIIGHSLSLFLNWRGGKGVATTIGVMFAILPKTIIAGLILWALVFYIWRYVSLASIVMGLSLPVFALFFADAPAKIWFAALIALVILVRHRANIQRLKSGREHKWERKAKVPPEQE